MMKFDHRDTKSTEIFYTRFRISAGNAKYSSSRDSDLAVGAASGSIDTVLIMLRQQRKRSGWPCLLGWAVFSPWRCRFDDPVNGLDSDGDGLTNYAERTQHHTNPAVSDTDDDGLTDPEELFTYFTNPLLQKTNPQQLYTDYYMVSLTDTDGDQIPDLIEQWYNSQGFTMNKDDPLDGKGDLDGDGYSNTQGYLNGWSLTMSFNNNFDNDGDRILDVLEDVWAAQYPGSLNKADPNDAVLDFDNDGVMNFEEIALGLNPGSPQTRSGPLTDVQVLAQYLKGKRLTAEGDGWLNALWQTITPTWLEANAGGAANASWLSQEDANENGVTDGWEAFLTEYVPPAPSVSASDHDGDGMPDAWEYRYNLNLRDAGDAQGNSDTDTLNNLEEFQQGRNPKVNDDPPPLQITTTSLPDGTVDAAYSAAVAATGGTEPHTFSISSGGSLPSGLSLDASSGTISGTPDTAGSSTFTVNVTDATKRGQSVDCSVDRFQGGG